MMKRHTKDVKIQIFKEIKRRKQVAKMERKQKKKLEKVFTSTILDF